MTNLIRIIFLFTVLLVLCSRVFGQQANKTSKQIIDTTVFGKWSSVEGWLDLSSDGNYVVYGVKNVPIGSNSLIVQSTFGGWRTMLSGTKEAMFCGANRWIVYQEGGDSLCLLGLGREERVYLPGVHSYYLSGDTNRQWLCYLADMYEGKGRLVLRNLIDGKERSWQAVSQYQFIPGGKGLLWESGVRPDSTGDHMLYWLDFGSGMERSIGTAASPILISPSGKAVVWENKVGDGNDVQLYVYWQDLDREMKTCTVAGPLKEGIGGVGFDSAEEQLAFIAPTKGSKGEKGLYYYSHKLCQTVLKAWSGAPGIDSGLLIADEPPSFSPDGKGIFFRLAHKLVAQPVAAGVPVTVWSYKDEPIHSLQNYYTRQPQRFMAVVSVKPSKIIQLERGDMRINGYPGPSNKYVLMESSHKGYEQWWQPLLRSSVYLVNLVDGAATILKKALPYAYKDSYLFYFQLSPGSQYVVHYDPVGRNYFSYEIATGIERNLTKTLSVLWKNSAYDHMEPYAGWPVGIAGFLSGDQGLLVYDNNDIWLLDLAGRRRPENITAGYGQAHHIRFRLVDPAEIYSGNIPRHTRLLLSAFDTQTKQSGFYKKVLGEPGGPEQLSMGAYKSSMVPLRAVGAEVWLTCMMRAEESPNYYVTRDFREFRMVSDVHPEQEYNWLTAELINWQLPDKTWSRGILYKPENFDSSKKYPLLMNYYELKSDDLYKYHAPEATTGNINIPYFVSRGYLVFLPDIHYRMGYTGESAREAIVSAALYLSKKSWVDSNRMGIDGHSFGGFETNYLVTHSHLFAAAVEASGVSDFVSAYGFIRGEGSSNNYMFELDQYRIRGTLWEKQNQYLLNSPVLKANQVTTPLLMMHNKGDGQVPYGQGVELFTALRRLGRRVWMLEYDKEGHTVGGRDAMDYTIRVEQFFDHYLKGALPPRWMTEGIPAARKGIDTGYELDSSGRKP